MIYIERKIKIKKNQAKIEEPIVLYRGDMNIELKFSIENNPFKFRTEKTYGRLIIKRPKANPIFSEPVEMSESRVIFIVTGDMIDGLDAEGNPADEEGAYDFQIQLLNEDQSSIGSLPEVIGGIIIKEPLCEGAVTNVTYVNKRNAYVMPENDMATFSLRDTNALFDEDGNYIKTYWEGGDIITDDRLNKVEDALYEINDNIPTDYVDKDFVDYAIINNNEYIEDYMDDLYTKKTDMYIYATTEYVSDYISDLEYVNHDYMTDMINNNNDYVLGFVDDKYTTEDYVDRAIANIELTPGPQGPEGPMGPQGEQGPAGKDADPVDLEGYATKDYVDNAISNIEIPEGGDCVINTINNITFTSIDQMQEKMPTGLYLCGWHTFINYDSTYLTLENKLICVRYYDKPDASDEGVINYAEIIGYDDFITYTFYQDGSIIRLEKKTTSPADCATKEYVDDAISNIEIPEGGGNELPIRVIGSDNPDEPYIFTGDEFTYEEYENGICLPVLLDNVDIAGTIFINELGHSWLWTDGDNKVISYDSQGFYYEFVIAPDGTITEQNTDSRAWNSDLDNYATKDELQTALGDIESLLGGI